MLACLATLTARNCSSMQMSDISNVHVLLSIASGHKLVMLAQRETNLVALFEHVVSNSCNISNNNYGMLCLYMNIKRGVPATAASTSPFTRVIAQTRGRAV